jgi:hypothetical protein
MTAGFRVLSVVVSVLIGACTSATSLSSPTPTVTNEVTASHTDAPTTSARPTAQMLVRGDLLTLPAEPDMVTFFAHGRSLIAWTSGNRPSPFLDKIQRADPPGGPWRTIFSNDAHFRIQRVSEGHMAIVAYREDGEGAYNESIVVLDLATGAATTIDHYALSKATFRGGGGAPRRPVGQIALGQQMIAWTHLFERAGGAVEGELRVAPLADPRATTVIARSTEWIEPVAIDQRSVAYVLGGSERDELRVRDIATGGDRHLTAFAAQTQVSGRGAPARSGPWVGWLETKPALAPTRAVPSIVTFEAFNIATGEERSMNTGGPGCSPLTANAFAFAWSCRSSADPPATLQAFDVAQWKLVDVLRPGSVSPFGLQAVDSGFVWTDADGAQRQVHLFTPAPGAFGQP